MAVARAYADTSWVHRRQWRKSLDSSYNTLVAKLNYAELKRITDAAGELKDLSVLSSIKNSSDREVLSIISSEDAKALLWLADSHRDRDFAISRPPARFEKLLVRTPAWARDPFCTDLKLPYVRCLALSHDGEVIVAGTKAGHVHVVRWNSEEKVWRHVTYERTHQPKSMAQNETEGPAHEAVRAIGVVGKTTVIAGTGAGTYLVFELAEGIQLVDRVESPQGEGLEWESRFTRMIPVTPPGRPFGSQPLMLGLTQGLDVHLLTRTDDGYRASTGDLTDFLPTWPEKGLRLIDGAWDGDRLWLLGENGYIYRFRWAPEPHDPQSQGELGCLQPDETPSKETASKGKGSKPPWKFGVVYPHSTFELRRLVACNRGLALLVSHHLTFLPFHSEGPVPCLEPEKARWVFIDQTADVAVWAPFHRYEPKTEVREGVLEKWKPLREPVWVVASSAMPGLHWTRWRRPSPRGSSRSAEQRRKLVPSETPSHQMGSGGVAQVAFGGFADGPNYLATVSRTHRLRITSVLHKSQVALILDRLMPDLLSQQGLSGVAAWSELAEEFRTPGVALWLLRARLYWDFQVEVRRDLLPETFRQSKIGPMMEELSVQDLRLLAHSLQWSWEGLGDLESKAAVFKQWVLEILRRGFQVAPEEPQRLARQIYDQIVNGVRPADDFQVRQSRRQKIWRAQGHFAIFLRKWIINGNTYAIKKTELLPRVLWNRSSGYALDAMVYLAKLTRSRFDTVWKATSAAVGGLPIWDMVAESQGWFSIQSSTDGSLRAVSGSGRAIRWALDEAKHTRESLAGKEVKLSDSDHSLNHRLAAKFSSQYHHGPYVRRLVLHEIESPAGPLYLLFGCFRGWRRQDYLQDKEEDSKRPRLVALLLRLQEASNVTEEDRLEIVAVETRAVEDELYAIQRLDVETASENRLCFMAGTRGVWGDRVTPFVEIALDIAEEAILIEEPRPADVNLSPSEEEGGRRGSRRFSHQDEAALEIAHNPCWCWTTLSVNGQLWLWAGFADGGLRCYQRSVNAQEEEFWLEGGGHGRGHDLQRDPLRPQDRSIPCTAAVWKVLYIEELSLLAYGTADGVVGLVSMEGLKQPDHRPWVHLLHSREMAPISSLILLRDPDLQLLTVSQDGYATIYHLEVPEKGVKGRFAFPGYWRDRFPFEHTVQSAVEVTEPSSSGGRELGGGDVQTLCLGSAEGDVYQHRLLMPRKSGRRQTAAKWFASFLEIEQDPLRPVGGTGTTPTLAFCVGMRDLRDSYPWLRVLDTGGLEMMRLSFWLQLHEVGGRLLQQTTDEAVVQEYLALLNELTHEAYSRRPFGRDPAKILWEEASKVANQIATRGLLHGDSEQAAAWLYVYNRINVSVDDLCNRWIGSEQPIEARVLIHSFNVFFDWPDIILIAWLDPPKEAVESQRFLLSNAIHRRLGYGEYIVRLETLRVINRAVSWAIVNVRNQTLGGNSGLQVGLLPLRRTSGSTRGHERPVGFYELIMRVGRLAESHHDSLSQADPLTSEITRFFALSILLVPECALIVGHAMSECRLLDRGPEISAAIAQQAADLTAQLNLEKDDLLRDGLARFEAYCSPKIDLRFSGETDPSWWRRMTEGGRETRRPADSSDKITDVDLLFEQRHALRAVRALVSLEPALEEDLDSGFEPPDSNALAWLDTKAEELAYFRHSRPYLRHLRATRTKIQNALDNELGAAMFSRAESPVDQASTYCDEALQGLEEAELFEPQRTQYREIILAWRDQIERRGRRAVAVLEAIDKFNRHIYRISADNFMSNTLELALQTAPLAFDRSSSGPLSQQIGQALEEGHPLLLEIFRNGTDLVEQTHLSGTLLALARYMLKKPRSHEELPFQPLHEVRLSEIETEIKNAARRHNLAPAFSGNDFRDAEEAVGTRAIWRTIVNEWVNNVSRHGRSQEEPLLRVRLDSAGQADASQTLLLLSGNVPFKDCLTYALQAELESVRKRDSDSEAAQWLLEQAKEVRQPRSSQKISPTSASGMGVFLIQTICGLVQLHTKIRLYDLGKGLSGQRPVSVDALECPLCLEISWVPPRAVEENI